MILVMPEAWPKQRAILKELGGLENDPFDEVTVFTPSIEDNNTKEISHS